MTCQRRFHSGGRFPPENQTFTLYAVFRILFFAFIFTTLTLSCSRGTPSDLTTAPVSAGSAGWAATYGGADSDDLAYSIKQTDDGGYILAGKTAYPSAGGKITIEFLVLKLSPDGSVEWQKTYGGKYSEQARSIQQTIDGGYIVAGATWSFGIRPQELWVLKLGADGNIEWQKTYGGYYGDAAYSIQQTGDGGYIVAGGTMSFGQIEMDSWVLKLSPDGSVEWQKTYGGEGSDLADSVRQTNDGGYIVAGSTESFGAGQGDLWVLKLKPNGVIEWQKTYGGEDPDKAGSIHQTDDGGYIVAGETKSFGAGQRDLWVLKLKPNGTIEWQKTYGGESWDTALSIQQTTDGGYIVAGETRSFGTESIDAWVLKLSPEGTVEWQKSCGGAHWDWACSIQQTNDGGYVMTGGTMSVGAGVEDSPDIWVLKLRPDGSIGPSCDLIRNTDVSGSDSNAIVKASSAAVNDTDAEPQDSSATVQDTDVSVNVLCSSATVE